MTLLFTIYYYVSSSGDRPIEYFLDSLSEKQQAKILRIFQYIQLYGLSAVVPHTKKLTGTPLWEIRILGNDNIRVVYAIVLRNAILVLNGFIKKSQKTPAKKLRLALERFTQWKRLHEIDK